MSRSGSKVEDLVSQALLINDQIGRAVIEVKCAQGIITLKGTISSEQHRLAAEVLASQQQGVVDVINKLRVPGY